MLQRFYLLDKNITLAVRKDIIAELTVELINKISSKLAQGNINQLKSELAEGVAKM